MYSSTLIFIGNGFDIAAGFHTSFGDFYKRTHFQRIKQSNPIAEHINAVNKKLNDWADLEYELYTYAKWLEEGDEPDKLFKEQCEELISALNLFLYDSIEYSDVSHSNYHLENLIKQWTKEDSNIQFITFNYTPILASYCSNLSLPLSVIRYVHGEMYNGTRTEPQIVIGIDESMEVTPDYQFLNKSFNRLNNNYNIHQMISYAKRIIVFGCAMGDTDLWYFEPIFKRSREKIIEVYVYKESNFPRIQQRITKFSNKKLADFKNDNHLILFDNENLGTLCYQRDSYFQTHPEIMNELNDSITKLTK